MAGRITRFFTAAAYLLCASALAQGSDTVEIFTDKGDTFIRAGSDHGLKVGSSVTIVGDKIGNTEERRSVGKASVMEVFPTIARVSLDKEAQAAAGEKYAKIPPHAKAAKPQASASASEAPKGAGLKGHASLAGVGPEISHKVMIYNDGSKPWTNCELRLPNNKRYLLQKLNANDSESIVLFNFKQDGVAYDKPIDSVTVKCAEGEARFTFTM